MDSWVVALRSFLVLAEELHFARAAERLHISPPSLSQQISRLETRVGRRLLVRSPRRVELTDAGRELRPLAASVVTAVDAVAHWSSGAPGDRPLRVGIVASGAGPLTGRILAEVAEAQPALGLELVHLGFFDVPAALGDGRVDVALALAPVAVGPGLTSTALVHEPRVLVVRDDHPLAQRVSVGISETDDLDFVVPRSAEGDALAWWLVDPRPSGRSPRISARADGVEGLMELCAAGLGVNIATRSAATQFARPGLAYVDIADIEPATVELVTTAVPRHPAVPLFAAVAQEVARLGR